MQIPFCARPRPALTQRRGPDTMKGEAATTQPRVWPRISALFKATCFFSTLSCLPFFGHSSSLFLRPEVNGTESRGSETRGRGEEVADGGPRRNKGVGDRTGRARLLCPGRKRCIVSLLHSFLILRSACVANPQKLRPPFPRFSSFSSLRLAESLSALEIPSFSIEDPPCLPTTVLYFCCWIDSLRQKRSSL